MFKDPFQSVTSNYVILRKTKYHHYRHRTHKTMIWSENGLNGVPKPHFTNTFQVGPTTVRLDTPRAVWTAGCCVWKEPGKFLGKLWQTEKAESFAVMSNNHYDINQLHQTERSVNDLEKRLKAAASTTNVHLFPGNTNCARNNKIL